MTNFFNLFKDIAESILDNCLEIKIMRIYTNIAATDAVTNMSRLL